MATRSKIANQSAIDPASIEAGQLQKKPLPIILTGYQYNGTGAFIGIYEFEKNRDKEDVHMPPSTTLLPPPANVSIDQEAFFDGEQWAARNLTLSHLPDRILPTAQELADWEDVEQAAIYQKAVKENGNDNQDGIELPARQ